MKQLIIMYILFNVAISLAQSPFEALATIQLPAPTTQNPRTPEEDPTLYLVHRCEAALEDCRGVVEAQDQDISRLKQDSKQLESQLAKDNSPLLPWYAWVGIGIIAGGVAGIELKGGH